MSQAADTNLWGLHASKIGDADSLFLNSLAVGWGTMGDLSAGVLPICLGPGATGVQG